MRIVFTVTLYECNCHNLATGYTNSSEESLQSLPTSLLTGITNLIDFSDTRKRISCEDFFKGELPLKSLTPCPINMTRGCLGYVQGQEKNKKNKRENDGKMAIRDFHVR